MSAKKSVLRAASVVCFLVASSASATTITVAKSGADFTTITDGIKAAMPGDVIKIMDVATYEEIVTIDSTKYPLTLTSKDPTSLSKPTIKYWDQTHVGPRTYAESQVDSLINYDRNGALRLIKVHNVIIDGVAINGGGVHPFGYQAVWEQRYALQYGNIALCVFESGDVVIRNCDISNAYYGVSFRDRNMGGIFASPNPADLDTMSNVPLSAYGLMGNHLVERNRIHDNSFGFITESSWDLGSTIRYNLIYENHHPTSAIATTVKGLTDEGSNQPGGAFFFKDIELSPWAICNNTFWHNFLIFAGHWQAGYQHLVFNNIFGPPNIHWTDMTPPFQANAMELTPSLINRVNSCVYSAQVQMPQATYVRIMDNMPLLQGAGGISPDAGTLWATTGTASNPGFPAAADNRWLEMDESKFLSTNPASTMFLEPKWSDAGVKNFILQKGWQGSGVKNTDGTWADLGAIEQAHGSPSFTGTIKPSQLFLAFDSVSGQARIGFSLDERGGTTMTDPMIKLFRLVRIKYKNGTFGPSDRSMVITAADMSMPIPPSTPPVKVGLNSYGISVTIPGDFAFIEMIIEAVGKNGNTFTSAVGFLPYRKLENRLVVEVLNKVGGANITQVRVGDTAFLRLTPQATAALLYDSIKPLSVTLPSGFALLTPGVQLAPLSYPDGIRFGPDTKPVIFTRIPEGSVENIAASGIARDSSTSILLFGGTSIKLISGLPSKVTFISPASNARGAIPPTLNAGTAVVCSVKVCDSYGNAVNESAGVVVKSLMPVVANVIGGKPDTTILTNAAGIGIFMMKTTDQARENNVVTIAAALSGNPFSDSADMIVGKPSTSVKDLLVLRNAFARRPSHEVTIKCFDLQGRRIFQKTYFSDMSLALLPRSLQKKISGIASKVYLLDIGVKDRVSLRQTRNVRKMVVR